MEKLTKFVKTVWSNNIEISEYIDWNKIQEDILNIQYDCNTLTFFMSNTKQEFLNKFHNFYDETKEAFKILPLLLSFKKIDINYSIYENKTQFDYLNKDNVLAFIEASGLLKNLFLNKTCKDILTYYVGIEVGLLSKSTKNNKLYIKRFEKILLESNITNFEKNVSLSKFTNIDDTDSDNSKFDEKKLDYVFEYQNTTYLVELNYFGTNNKNIDNKLDELTSFNNFVNEYNKKHSNKNLKFLYITDGKGWLNNLELLKNLLETMDNCYNFYLFEEMISNSNHNDNNLIKKDIDKHIKNVVTQILILKTRLDVISNWHNNDWNVSIDKKIKKFKKDYEGITNKFNVWEEWVTKYAYEPTKYQYCVYVRSFLDSLKVYLKKNHRDYIRYVEMWESSKYLEYYIHLIFKTKKYKNKIFKTNEEIILELEKLTSYLSKPLHAFSIYFIDNINSDEYSNKDINSIVDLILNRGINDDVIKHPIDPEVAGDKQKYLECTTSFEMNKDYLEQNLNFWKEKCLEEFNKNIKFQKKLKKDLKNLCNKH